MNWQTLAKDLLDAYTDQLRKYKEEQSNNYFAQYKREE